MLRWMCGVIRSDRIKNENLKGSLKLTNMVRGMKENRPRWFGHVLRGEIMTRWSSGDR